MFHAQLVSLLADLAYKEGEFQLSSGQRSDFYLDAKQVTYHPDGVRAVGHEVLRVVKDLEFDSVGGLTMGADAIAQCTVWAGLEQGLHIPAFVVRKDAKGHGLGKVIEGVYPEGKRVIIVDDVITSGQSVLKALDAVKNAGATVVAVVGLVDREQGGAGTIEAQSVPFRAICTVSEIRAAHRTNVAMI